MHVQFERESEIFCYKDKKASVMNKLLKTCSPIPILNSRYQPILTDINTDIDTDINTNVNTDVNADINTDIRTHL